MLIIRMETEQGDGLQQCADIIKNGGTVAFPTETVYGALTHWMWRRSKRYLKQRAGRGTIL